MKPPPFEYEAVDTVEAAVDLLASHGDDAKVLAGGQSLLPLLGLRLARPAMLVDVNRVASLRGVQNGNGLLIGAMTRQYELERSSQVATIQPMLRDATRLIGHTAIRNRGTIGGSLAHADPAAELPAALLALGGEVEVRSIRGVRSISASELFAGFLTTTLDADELITEVHVPELPPRTGWSFIEFSRRSGDFAVVGAAVTLTLDPAGVVARASLAFSGVDATPVQSEAAAGLAGEEPSDDALSEVARQAAGVLDPADDLHGSAAYRRHLAAVLASRALSEARERAEAAS
jgi:carbon-monoxide dehydrogenase medium subunit